MLELLICEHCGGIYGDELLVSLYIKRKHNVSLCDCTEQDEGD